MADEITTTTGDDRLSVLGSLKARREEIRTEDVLDLPVARWENPEIVVRYHPVEHEAIRRVQRQVERAPKQRQATAEVDGNIDILIRGCVGVYAVLDGQQYSLRPGDEKGELTRFDEDLAANFGIEHATAREVVKALFFTDGDILSHATELVRFSGYRDTEATTRAEGE